MQFKLRNQRNNKPIPLDSKDVLSAFIIEIQQHETFLHIYINQSIAMFDKLKSFDKFERREIYFKWDPGNGTISAYRNKKR